MFGGIDDIFKRADERHLEMKQEFDRRAADCQELPIPGDKIVLHAGLLQRGHMWERLQGECVAVATNSVLVRYKKSYDETMTEQWVHPALITDILKASVPAE
ncbi:MAG: hypothetical protein E6R03_11010 [Hyphomicrobiaceae bacterium]|nr:MAG: hypothetical protein E6R03_11010 [Hyphomicrobiaceae bacterium]